MRKQQKSLQKKSNIVSWSGSTPGQKKVLETAAERNRRIMNSVQTFYKSISELDGSVMKQADNDCIAVKLAKLVINIVSEGSHEVEESFVFSNDFYEECLIKAGGEGISGEIKDDELLIIYLKQTVIMLKSGGVIFFKNRRACIDEEKVNDLYSFLLNTFWNIVKWKEIFPSDPKTAEALQKNRDFFASLVLNSESKIKIDNLTKRFFSEAGIAGKDDVLYVSFLDFYLFTWLRHFNIVNYVKNGYNSPVYIELSSSGAEYLDLMRK